jgi:hypothetical protein
MLSGQGPIGKKALDSLDLVNLAGQRFDTFLCDQNLRFPALGRRCESRSDPEELLLNRLGPTPHVFVFAMGPRQAESGIQFVHRPIGLNAQ